MPPKEWHFSTGYEVHNFFRSNRQGLPLDALKALRNRLSLKPDENVVHVQDVRLILVKEWLELAPAGQDVFTVMEEGPQAAALSLCLSILASLLTLTSQHPVYESIGQPIVTALLSSRWMRKLHSYLSSANYDVCLMALKVLHDLANFAGGRQQKMLLEAFQWDVKVFRKLLYMRRKERMSGNDMHIRRPDIRTLCLQFILSFLSSPSHIKTMFLEHHHDLFLSIFKGLSGDPYSVVRFVLEVMWTKLWQDHKIKRTLKVGLFGERTLQHLVKLYERAEHEGPDPENVTADVAHHFLLAICSHRGLGVCFADNGWYPGRGSEDEITFETGAKIHNKILANILKMLKVYEDPRQQELALKILRACPELASGYLQSVVSTLEPRLSSKWLSNVALFGAIVSLPIPSESFYLSRDSMHPTSVPARVTYKPAPPPLSTVIGNILPSANLKGHLSKGLQSSHGLVQHAAGLALTQCLLKFAKVREHFLVVEQSLEEEEADGLWARRRNEIELKVRKRVPEISVVIAFSNSRSPSATSAASIAMRTELSQRLLWMYHRCVPSLVAEFRYDLAKTLRNSLDVGNNPLDVDASFEGLDRLQRLHVLRLLIDSDQFVWQAKAGPSAPSNLRILLDSLVKERHASIREALSTLLTRTLENSLLFQHDPDEILVWLDSLPAGVRPIGGETPDGAPLKDERECVLSFLEASMLRCAKTPHRYIEERDAVCSSSGSTEHSLNVSPLMITILEQLNARMRNKTLEPLDALALTTFIRKVIVALLDKQPNVQAFRSLANSLAVAVSGDDTFVGYPLIAGTLRRECSILYKCIDEWCSPMSSSPVPDDATEETASRAPDDSIPLGCDDMQTLTAGCTLQSAVEMARMRWSLRMVPLPHDMPIDKLLCEGDWTDDVCNAICASVYRSPVARHAFWSWLISSNLSEKPPLRSLVPVIHAFFDCNSEEQFQDAAGKSHVSMLFKALAGEFYCGTLDDNLGRKYAVCLAKILLACPNSRDELVATLSKQMSYLQSNMLHLESLRLVHQIGELSPDCSIILAETTLEHALRWVVRHVSEEESSNIRVSQIADITEVVRLRSNIPSHLVEPVIIGTVPHHLWLPQCVLLAEALVARTTLKPASTNRILQSVLQSAAFDQLMAAELVDRVKDAVTRLLFSLFLSHPSNTCQPSHVEPLIRLYTGTLASTDRRLLAIFHLFEEQRGTSISSIIALWSRSRSSQQGTSLDALQSLDAVHVFRTCLSFPNRRTIRVRSEQEVTASGLEDGLVYDPLFLLLLFAQMVEKCAPKSALSWISLCRTNIVSLLVRCLSSADQAIRQIALQELGWLYRVLQTVDLQEKVHVIHLLHLIRNKLGRIPDNDEAIPCLPSHITLFLAHALRGIFYPADFTYPLTARFLLQRHELDLSDVPMLYGMLHSSGDVWRKERAWLVRYLADGMLCKEDWRVLKRRHVWDLLASLFQGNYHDKVLRSCILQVLANMTCHEHSATSLVLRSSVIQWIEMQLLSKKDDECVAWTKIIENIVTMSGRDKIEKATHGTWQSGLLRCLMHLIIEADIYLLRLISRVMSRLDSEELRYDPSLLRILKLALDRLVIFEESNCAFMRIENGTRSNEESLPPHHSFGLHRERSAECDIETWKGVVESLWGVAVKYSIQGAVLDHLSCRLLLCRALFGAKGSFVGEWARNQVVRSIASG